MKTSVRFRFIGYFLCLVLSITCSFAEGAELPQNWQSLPANEFVEEVNKLIAAGEIDAETQLAINRHSADFLVSTNVITSVTDYGVVASLIRWGKSELTAAQMANVTQQLTGRDDTAVNLTTEEKRHKFSAVVMAEVEPTRRAAALAAWMQADPAVLAEVPEKDLVGWYDVLAYPHLEPGEFSVRWSGTVTPPGTGAYTFSISPINVNADLPSYLMRNNWRISVGGQPVLVATAADWRTNSTPVQLQAGAPVELVVETQYVVSERSDDVLPAILYWQGPGFSRQVIPSNALKTPDGASAGLLADYFVEVNGNPQTVRRTDPAIDFAWKGNRRVVSDHQDVLQALRTQIWQRCMNPQFLARCEADAATGGERHPFLSNMKLVECLTSAQRRAFLQELLQRPSLLAPLQPPIVADFFKAYRCGAEAEALAVLGLWCNLHADLAAKLPSPPGEAGHYISNRAELDILAACVGMQYPPHAEELAAEYLERPDGRCSLPVAYMLAYVYQGQGRMEGWIELLDERLSDESLGGDQRVNWLFARAMAEEIRNDKASFLQPGREQLLSGQGWLDEAALVAESNEAGVRIARERIARLAAMHQWQEAEAEVQAAPALAAWGPLLGAMQEQVAAAIQQQAVASRDSYRNELLRRRQIAVDSGDTASADRFAELINSFEAGPNN